MNKSDSACGKKNTLIHLRMTIISRLKVEYSFPTGSLIVQNLEFKYGLKISLATVMLVIFCVFRDEFLRSLDYFC
jgi:hypothetical protein